MNGAWPIATGEQHERTVSRLPDRHGRTFAAELGPAVAHPMRPAAFAEPAPGC
ncbi:hypothetical protein Ga0609869_002147 [Rhodovulum iodosum]|uniref:Uncharacterized protein n=1 Tax=Rhodovulum iodosum TaxID=68291 RepID=A0ABV3XUN5_9RHOB